MCWKEARDGGFGSVNDTVALKANGKIYELDASKFAEGEIARLTIVKGNKFKITGFVPGGVFATQDKKLVSVSRKGVVKGKKSTKTSSGGNVTITYSVNNKTAFQLQVTVVEPVFATLKVREKSASGNTVSGDGGWVYVPAGKKSGPSFTKPVVIVVGLGQEFDAVLDIPTNVNFDTPAKNADKYLEAGSYKVQYEDDNLLHVKGITAKKGSTKHIMTVNGKKFTVKVKVKD